MVAGGVIWGWGRGWGWRPGAEVGPALGLDAAEWPVPYWMGDAAFGVMTVLLCAVDAGLGACVLGNFRGEKALANTLGVPAEWRLFCAVLLGHPDGKDHPSRSLDRARPGPDERIHPGVVRAGLRRKSHQSTPPSGLPRRPL